MCELEQISSPACTGELYMKCVFICSVHADPAPGSPWCAPSERSLASPTWPRPRLVAVRQAVLRLR
eukprot:scaffold4178_cov57-Phaeocystis_antarctica.AAC.3